MLLAQCNTAHGVGATAPVGIPWYDQCVVMWEVGSPAVCHHAAVFPYTCIFLCCTQHPAVADSMIACMPHECLLLCKLAKQSSCTIFCGHKLDLWLQEIQGCGNWWRATGESVSHTIACMCAGVVVHRPVLGSLFVTCTLTRRSMLQAEKWSLLDHLVCSLGG